MRGRQDLQLDLNFHDAWEGGGNEVRIIYIPQRSKLVPYTLVILMFSHDIIPDASLQFH